MELDLFATEQEILERAISYSTKLRSGAKCDSAAFNDLVNEYAKLLKQLRRATRLADRTAINLFDSNLSLTDKVHLDALTGIFNRRYMDESLQRVIRSMNRTGGGELSFMMIDIDNFKKYNDTYGHGEGDKCLASVAKALKESVLRPEDILARYGGEEFAVILPDAGKNGVCSVAARIIENIRALNIKHEASEAASCVTVSIGGAAGDVSRIHDGKELIKRSDEALYAAKQDGRNRYVYMDLED